MFKVYQQRTINMASFGTDISDHDIELAIQCIRNKTFLLDKKLDRMLCESSKPYGDNDYQVTIQKCSSTPKMMKIIFKNEDDTDECIDHLLPIEVVQKFAHLERDMQERKEMDNKIKLINELLKVDTAFLEDTFKIYLNRTKGSENRVLNK